MYDENILELQQNLLRIPRETEDYSLARMILHQLSQYKISNFSVDFNDLDRRVSSVLNDFSHTKNSKPAVFLVIENWLEEMRSYQKITTCKKAC